MKKIKVEITGTSPILMNKYDIEAELNRKAGRSTTKKYDSKVEAEKSAYWSAGKKKELIIPSYVLYAALLNASSFYKVGKRSAKAILAGSVTVKPMEISLNTDKYEIDVRPVVIIRAKVLKSRARIDKWKVEFEIIYNEQVVLDTNILKNILTDTGIRVGIFDFRPQRGGPYGCFDVTKWEELD